MSSRSTSAPIAAESAPVLGLGLGLGLGLVAPIGAPTPRDTGKPANRVKRNSVKVKRDEGFVARVRKAVLAIQQEERKEREEQEEQEEEDDLGGLTTDENGEWALVPFTKSGDEGRDAAKLKRLIAKYEAQPDESDSDSRSRSTSTSTSTMASKRIDLGDECAVEMLYNCVGCTDEEFAGELERFPTTRNPTVFGATTPRREVLYSANAGTTYSFSKKTLVARKPSPIASRCLAFAKNANAAYNTVLGNLYESGKDYVGAHSDDEPEHGAGAPIFGFSFGATRTFQIKRKDKGAVLDGGKTFLNVELPHGSCVIMRGEQFQTLFTHSITKTAKAVGPRISYTARIFE
jgi:alkylated DNA repair dioxygenase AlkB